MSHPMDAIAALPRYAGSAADENRLLRRYDHIVAPFRRYIAQGRVLDLASHDGRWCYALAAAGAEAVVGIEARQETIDLFADYPDDAHKARVDLRQGDIFEALEGFKAAGETFDVVSVFGIFYHITEHYRLLLLIQALSPRLIIIDGVFVVASERAMVRFLVNDTSNPLNSVARREGAAVELVGTPTLRFVDKVGEITGYSTHWVDWDLLPEDDRLGLDDYYRVAKPRRRATVAMRRLEEFDPHERRPRAFLDPVAGLPE